MIRYYQTGQTAHIIAGGELHRVTGFCLCLVALCFLCLRCRFASWRVAGRRFAAGQIVAAGDY